MKLPKLSFNAVMNHLCSEVHFTQNTNVAELIANSENSQAILERGPKYLREIATYMKNNFPESEVRTWKSQNRKLFQAWTIILLQLIKENSYANAPYTTETPLRTQKLTVWTAYLTKLADAIKSANLQKNVVEFKNGNCCYFMPIDAIAASTAPANLVLPKVRMHDVEGTSRYLVKILEPGSFSNEYQPGQKIQVSSQDLVPLRKTA